MAGSGSIDGRERADGSIAWRVRWTDETGRHTRTYDREADARAALAKIEQARARGTYRPPSRLTVKDVIEQYIERKRGVLKPSTIRNYTIRSRQHIFPHLGHIEVDRLTTLHVQRWIDTIKHTAKVGTLRISMAVLRASLAEAVRLGIVETNVARDALLPPRTEYEVQIWTEAEILRVLEVTQDEAMAHAVYTLALTLGTRPGELLALHWSDIDWERERIHIRHTITTDEAGRVVVRKGTKRGPGRTVRLSQAALDALRRWQEEQGGGEYLFNGSEPISAYRWRVAHRRVCRAAKVPEITLHALRHTAASSMMERGVHQQVVAATLGHKGTAMTQRYSHPSEEFMGTAAAAMDTMLRESMLSHDTTSD